MELNTNIIRALRITMYWFVSTFFATAIISAFSTFSPHENIRFYMEYGLDAHVFRYVKQTLQFFLFLSFVMAVPGYISNLVIYFMLRKPGKSSKAKFFSIMVNILITAVVLFFYDRLNITRREDLIYVIAPVYVLSFFMWGVLLLPSEGKEK